MNDNSTGIDPICKDDPTWSIEAPWDPEEILGCNDTLEISCTHNEGAKDACCNCKKECCGKCGVAMPDIFICGFPTAPTAAPYSYGSPIGSSSSSSSSSYSDSSDNETAKIIVLVVFGAICFGFLIFKGIKASNERDRLAHANRRARTGTTDVPFATPSTNRHNTNNNTNNNNNRPRVVARPPEVGDAKFASAFVAMPVAEVAEAVVVEALPPVAIAVAVAVPAAPAPKKYIKSDDDDSKKQLILNPEYTAWKKSSSPSSI